MRKIVFLATIGVIIFSSCKKKDDNPLPSACFLVDKTESTDPGHTFNFNNCSDNYNTSSWNFGDGHSSTDESPSHRFNNIGQYTIILTVTNSGGVTSTNTRVITIGHYTLTKIIYNKLNGTVPYPKHAYWSRYDTSLGMQYNNDAAVSNSTLIPFTVELPDDPLYDNYY